MLKTLNIYATPAGASFDTEKGPKKLLKALRFLFLACQSYRDSNTLIHTDLKFLQKLHETPFQQ